MPPKHPAYVPNELLSRLMGFRLYSVQFVMDFVQLHFDGPAGETPVLTCEVFPAVGTPRDEIPPSRGRRQPADVLVALIGGEVIGTSEATGTGLRIDLTTGSIVLHPEQDDVVGPEIALLNGFADGMWMCWRPGEDSFEDLA